MVRELSNLAAYHEALSSAGNKLVVIEFIGSWSPPCKIMEPKFEKYSQTYPDVLFFKVNVDDVKDISEFCGIKSIPTFQFYKSNKKMAEITGPEDAKIVAKIKALK